MTDAFAIKHYSILTSFDKTQIYIKMVDTMNHLVYETSVDLAELRLSLTLEDVYKIITSCFGEDDGYKVAITVKSGLMKMKFHALIGGFLKVDFDIFIKEKIMSNDNQLTLFVTQLEQKQETMFETLTKRCDELLSLVQRQRREIDLISNAELEIRLNTNVPLNVQSIVIQGDGHMKTEKIRFLYKLQRLTLTSFSFADLSSVSSTSLKELSIDATGNVKFASLQGIEGFPNLESIILINTTGLQDLSGFAKSPKLKSIKIVGQTFANMRELKVLCDERNIHLDYKPMNN